MKLMENIKIKADSNESAFFIYVAQLGFEPRRRSTAFETAA